MKKMFKHISIVVLSLLLGINSFAQNRISRSEYISRYADIAVKKMKEYGIPASITLAQGILESDCGNSFLATEAKNHFGIKCHDWQGESVTYDDDLKNECFRKYINPEESFDDYSAFLTGRERYAFLFEYRDSDYKSWAYGLKKAGYATDPQYPERLIKIIEEEELYKFDKHIHKNTHKEIEIITNPDLNLKVLKNNGAKYIYMPEGMTLEDLCYIFKLKMWEIKAFNDLSEESANPKPNEIVYIESKASRASWGYDTHIIKEGENLHSVSQLYGIKLKSLLKKNSNITFTPLPGQIIQLR